MRVLVTGGTGYLGAAIVRALQARGHHARRLRTAGIAAGLPGTPHRRRRARPRRRAPGGRRRRRHHPCRGAGQRLAQAAADFDDINVEGLTSPATCARGRDRHVVYTSSFLALPPRAAHRPPRGERLPADQGAGARRARAPPRRGCQSSSSFPASCMDRARRPKGIWSVA